MEAYRHLLAESLYASLAPGRILVVCSEPGYLPDGLLSDVAHLAKRDMVSVRSRGFEGLSSPEATETLVKFARSVRASLKDASCERLVVLDGLPPSDESETARQASALGRVARIGASILLSITPEARQLLDGLPDHVVVGANDISTGLVARAQESWPYTRGIPSLAAALPPQSLRAKSKGTPLGRNYLLALEKLIDSSVRPSLCDEEVSLRIAAILLGEGSLYDLAGAVGALDPSLYDDLVAWAPFFGIDFDDRSFSCVTAFSTEWTGMGLPRFREVLGNFPELVAACLKLLGSRGEFVRIGALVRLLPPHEAVAAVYEWGPELLDGGEAALVKSVLDSWGEKNPLDERLALLKECVAALTVRRYVPTAAPPWEGAPRDACTELLRLLLGCRHALRSSLTNELFLIDGASEMGRRLTTHLTCVEYLESGKARNALGVLYPFAADEPPTTLSGCLLKVDLATARALLCDTPWDGRRVLRECRAFLESRGLLGMTAYTDILEAVLEALESTSRKAVAATASIAGLAGDVVAEAVGLVAQVIIGLRSRPTAHLHTQALLAQEKASALGVDYARRLAVLLGRVASHVLGEPSAPRLRLVGDGLGSVADLVYRAMAEGTDDLPPTQAVGPVPVDELWLVIALTNCSTEFSQLLESQIPAGWRRAVSLARRNCTNVEQADVDQDPLLPAPAPSPASQEALSASATRSGGLVRVCLLGEFCVMVGSRRVPDDLLDKRGAKALLECLVLQKNQMASRLRLAELIWPGVADQKKAKHRVYMATSTIRQALQMYGVEDQVFVANRGNAVLSFTPGLVSSDVEEFSECARAAATTAVDSKACELALRSELLYAGDLCGLSEEMEVVLATERSRLRASYVDAMVAGAEAALRLDKKRLAARFARNALAADRFREDAETVLQVALRESGRSTEARRRYEAFVDLLVHESGRIPSRMLREAATPAASTRAAALPTRPLRAAAGA